MRQLIAAVVLAVASGSLTTPAAQAEQTRPADTRILVVGDSVTQGWVGDHTWRYFLWRHLVRTRMANYVDLVGHRTGPANWFDGDVQGPDRYANPNFDVDHGAKWGGTIQEVVDPDSYYAANPDDTPDTGDMRWTDEVQLAQPDIIVSLYGTNDLGRRQRTVDQVIGDTRLLVQQARAVSPSVTFILGQLPHEFADVDTPAYNAALLDLAAELSTPDSPVVIALKPGDYTSEGDTKDGIHPNAQGEQKIAGEIATVLDPMLASIVVPLARPRHVRAARQAGGKVRLRWARVSGAAAYTVRCTSQTTVTTAPATTLRSPERIVCRVRARRGPVRSRWSARVVVPSASGPDRERTGVRGGPAS